MGGAPEEYRTPAVLQLISGRSISTSRGECKAQSRRASSGHHTEVHMPAGLGITPHGSWQPESENNQRQDRSRAATTVPYCCSLVWSGLV